MPVQFEKRKFMDSFLRGDIWTKLSFEIFGMGYFVRGQYIKGILLQLIQILFFVFTFGFSLNYIAKLSTLGTVQREEVFDPKTLTKVVNDYDNSLLILLCGIIGILFIAAYIILAISNVKANYFLQQLKESNKHINSFREDVRELFNHKFHKTLLTLPGLGIILVNVIPIIFLICIAFTNYDGEHQPPTYLFSWVGLSNFKTLFTTTSTVSFGYVFVRVLIWTLVWAFFSTATTFFGGIVLAKFINDKRTKFPKFWRTCFVITIAIPQFVTLLLVGKMFGDYGIVNGICNRLGITEFLQNIGLVGKGLSYIPFLSKPGWAFVSVILINIWVGVPFQMISSTGILMNIPADQLESARIDGASERQIFWKITMPYILFITGPSLISSFIANINNFNVIYLLTSGGPNKDASLYQAGETDILVTWLFKLTLDNNDYNTAAAVGILVFIVCATLSLITFNLSKSSRNEEEFS